MIHKRFHTILVLLLLSAVLTGTVAHSMAQGIVSLRQIASQAGLPIGAAARADVLAADPAYALTLAQEYNVLTPENEMKFGRLAPTGRGQYDFSAADSLVNFALANGMQVHGHTLVWHKNLPAWLTDGKFTRDEMIAILHEHITTVVSHFRGRVDTWDVVNEAISSTGGYRDTIWLRAIGPEYIEMAFQWAHEADPDARLLYNDYGGEAGGTKFHAIYSLTGDLKQRGVPIDGVGFQMHLRTNLRPNPDTVAYNFAQIVNLGLEVQITELDIRIQDDVGTLQERLNTQAEIYGDMLQTCLRFGPSCSSFITWGYTDRYSWIPGYTGNPDAPLPFDENIQPKAAYYTLANTLEDVVVPPPTSTPPPDMTIPNGPAVVVDVQPAAAAPGEQVSVALRLYHVNDVYGLQADCQVDPTQLVGANRTDGEGFNNGNGFIVDQGFQNDGKWKVAATRLQPNPAISGDTIAFNLGYTVQGNGASPVNCEVLAVNGMGTVLPVQVVNGAFNGAPAPESIPIPPPPTPEPLPIDPLPLPAPVILSTISGLVTYQNRPDNAGISVALQQNGATVATVTTNAEGRFDFTDVPMGTYTVMTSAPLHLGTTLTVDVTADGQTLDVSAGVLLAGDTDNSGTVDLTDAAFIGANFGLDAPLAPDNADMNGDQVVNIADLAMVGANYNLTAPLSAQ
ncbi:MAG: endo-1,4-beta-xylanase [Anaerolineaceae bacterium]|nr:endo-1,4-beta-xylanase [Anaerolineaceae bacterium]